MIIPSGGAGATFTVDTSEALLVALYLRDRAGLGVIGSPRLPLLRPRVKPQDERRVVAQAGSYATLQVEWEAWWRSLLRGRIASAQCPALPEFSSLRGMPALRLLARAHSGAAGEWAQERCADYVLHVAARGAGRVESLLARIVEERELDLGRKSRAFDLEIVELPLGAQRAWWVEPHVLLLCQDLAVDEPRFRSYVEPVVRMLA